MRGAKVNSNEVLEEDPTFPTRDSVRVVAGGRALFSLRTQAADARLEADRRVAETKGAEDAKFSEAEGPRRAASQQERAHRADPTQRQIDKIRAFCGADGCDARVVGGSLDGTIADVGK